MKVYILTGNRPGMAGNFLSFPFHRLSYRFLWTIFIYFHLPLSTLPVPKNGLQLDFSLKGFFTNWQAMHLSDKCTGLLVGSCSQSIQTSDYHLLIYAPLRGAEYLSPNARNKKEGHPTGCDSDEMPLGTKVFLLLFLLFLSPSFPLLFQDSGTARCRFLP